MKTKTDIWMPLYINDFLTDTLHLSAEELGAYMLIIMNYWKKGAIGGDTERISRVARSATSITQALLDEYFIYSEGEWKHPRVEKELQIARENKEKKAKRAKAGAAARWGHNHASSNAASNAPGNTPSNAIGKLEDCLEDAPSPTPSPSKKNKENFKKKTEKSEAGSVTLEEVETYAREIGSQVSPEYFFTYYEARDWKWGKTPIVNWSAVFDNWDLRLREKEGQETESATKPAADHRGVDEDVPEEDIQNFLESVGAKPCHA